MDERYLLFAGQRYYPSGGWDDYKMSFNSTESAMLAINGFQDDYDWWQIVDRQTLTVVREEPCWNKKVVVDG